MSGKKSVVALVHRDVIPGTSSKYTSSDFETVMGMVKECFDLSVGGAANLIKDGKTVLIKPNIVSARASPDTGIITDPRVLEATIKIIKESVSNVTVNVGENTAGGASRMAFQSGTPMGDAIRRAGVDEIIPFDECPLVTVKIRDAKNWYEWQIPKAVLDCDVYISIPKLKGHMVSQVTLTLKNAMGLLRHEDMQARHRSDLYQMIVDINKARKPDFAIVDAIHGLAYDHASRYPEHALTYNTLIAGTDAVAVDAVGGYLMGWNNPAREITILRIAQHDGLGVADMNKIDVKGADPDKLRKNLVIPFDEHAHTGYFAIPYEPCPLEAVFEGVEMFFGGVCLGCKSYIRMNLEGLYETGMLAKLVESVKQINVISGRNAHINPAMLPLPGITVVYGDCAVDKWGEIVKKWSNKTAVIPGCCPSVGELGGYLRTLMKEHGIS